MGKKRVKVINNQEEKLKTSKVTRIKSGKADEARLADMGQKALEDLEKIKAKEKELEKEVTKKVKEEKKVKPPKLRSRRYQTLKVKVDRNKLYALGEAVELLMKLANSRIDESVELHLSTLPDKLTGSVNLPYGTGKTQIVAIADDKLLDKVSKGEIDFDILIAAPAMMPKLARVAKILGPKGLMPNPKAGTITDRPEELKKKLEGGQIRFKTEPKAPLIHLTIGKVSFGEEKLLENLKAFLTAVGQSNILKASICSTMGPGIKLDLKSVEF